MEVNKPLLTAALVATLAVVQEEQKQQERVTPLEPDPENTGAMTFGSPRFLPVSEADTNEC